MTVARRSFIACAVFVVIGLLCPSHSVAQIDPGSIVGIWLLDEGSGTIAKDSSGHAYDADLKGNPTWVTGRYGSGLEFQGTSYLDIRNSAQNLAFGGAAPFTITAWVKNQGGGTIMGKFNGGVIGAYILSVSGTTLSFHRECDPWAFGGSKALPSDDFAHVAATYDGAVMKLYVNAELDTQQDRGAQNTDTATPVFIGARMTSSAPSEFFHGVLDEVALFDVALTPEQIREVMGGLASTEAMNPVPPDESTDIRRNTSLAWTAPETTATHNVYFGASWEDVNAATTSDPRGVLVSQGQTATAYTPQDLLAYGQTYFWRIDEVNGTPDFSVFRGKIWSFTVEPFAYPLANVTAAASSAQPGMGPENTVNGSGLNAADGHSTELADMWMSSGTQPEWIQYEFDNAYKIDEMWIWNSNQLIEAFIGFGARNVAVEYSLDGQTWTALEGVPEFARATGSAGYTANTTLDFGGVLARFVKLTINATWGGVAPQTGLSEVRFFYVPVQARDPQPAIDATDVAIDAELTWRAGREAEAHEVYLGTDAGALALVDTVTAPAVTPGTLDFGTTYFWKVNEVGGAGPYEGEVWSFTTQEFALLDGMETYNDDDNRIYDTWIDGLTTGASGSQVGYDVSPFAERTTVHSGLQAMPLLYDNAAAPFLSEAERTFDAPQNWTAGGADSLSLYFQGRMPAFAETATGNVLMNAIGTDIWDIADQFRFAYKTLNGNGTMIARVDSLFNSNAWAKGGVMIRQSIEPGSTHAFMALTPGGSGAGNGASFQHRLAANGVSTNNDNTGAVVTAPYWVKIERNGNNFTGSISPDGTTWTQVGATAQTIPMTASTLIGLALCSHDVSISTGAEFSNLATTGNVSGAWQVAEIGVAQPAGNSPEGLYVTIKDNAGKSKTVLHPDPAATVRGGWQHWTIPLSEFTAAGVKMNAVKSMTIGVGNKVAPAKGGAGTVFLDDLGYGRPRP